MNGNEYDGLDFGESCDYDVHERNERLTAENAKLRAWLRDLAIEADRVAYALRQLNQIALQILTANTTHDGV